MSLADTLKTLPGISHLAAMNLLDGEGKVIANIENAPGQTASLSIYNHLAQIYGVITPEAAAKGLELYGEVSEEARLNPGKHPNIDRLIGLVERQESVRIKAVFAF